MPNATLTKNLPNETQHLLQKMPKDMKKISEQIISDQQVLKQLVPKILRAILNIRLQQMFQKPKQTNLTNQNTQDQKIINLTESKITAPRTAYLNDQVQLFSPDELKNAIYRYNQNLTKINDITKKTGNIHLLDQLTDILDISAHTTSPT